MMNRIREFLGFERESLPVAYGPSLLSAVASVKEIAAIELKARLVGEDLHHASALLFAQGADLVKAAVRRDIEHPVVVISAAVLQLYVLFADPLPYGMRLAEVERRIIYRHQCARRDEVAVHRGDGGGRDGQHMVEYGASPAAVQVVECVVGQVYRRSAVGGRLIFDIQFARIRKGIGQQDGEITLRLASRTRCAFILRTLRS